MTRGPHNRPLHLSGSPYECGRSHGRTYKGEIHEVIARWKAELENEYELPADEAIDRFVRRTDFLSAIETWTPYLLDEIRGIADGCQIDFDTVFAFQCVDEVWANSDRIVGEHCTSLGFRGDASEPALLAQTVDVEAFRDGSQMVLRIDDAETGTQSLVTTCAGAIGFNGLNRWGVGVCCNAELQLRHASTGLPVACVMRGVLRQRTVSDALDFLAEVPHASGQHYLVGDPSQVRSIECSSAAIAEFRPSGIEDVVWHTNHPLANDDLHPWYRELLEAGASYPFLDNSRARLSAVEKRLRAPSDGTRFEQFAGILSSSDDDEHPVCAAHEGDTFYAKVGMFTFASTIMVLSESPELHVTLGPPDRFPRHVLGFDS
jgi:isopenicillin-N N-acyltransferase like protein